VWEHGHAVDGASIVLVTPEKAVSPAFGTFISRVRQTQRLDRVVIDECHIILNDRGISDKSCNS
jgi:superfamily II DNA helicase RecQ